MIRRLVTAAAFSGAFGSSASAQAVVSGQVTLLESPGARSSDLANAVVWLDNATASPAARSDVSIAMESRTFVPHVRVVGVGSSVGFPNHDPFRHNVFSKSGPGDFDLGLYARGDTRQAKFDRAGVYPVFCNIHARMIAFVVAVRSAYVTQPGADGRFSIANVSPGNYTLRVWHDRGGEAKQDVTVAADGTRGIQVQLDARNYRFVQHKNKFGQDYPPDGRDRY